MYGVKLVEDTLLEMDDELKGALDGLTPDELSWRPTTWANSIGFTLWHVTRAEDLWIQKSTQGIPQLFETGEWAGKWGIPSDHHGAGYDEDKLASFPNPPLEELLGYYGAVRQHTIKYLGQLTEEGLVGSLKAPVPRHKDYTVGRMFSHLLSEIGQHLGHIRYVRGLQRGLNL